MIAAGAMTGSTEAACAECGGRPDLNERPLRWFNPSRDSSSLHPIFGDGQALGPGRSGPALMRNPDARAEIAFAGRS